MSAPSPEHRSTLASGSASVAEKNASSSTVASATRKQRSCVVCRTRKVRCDKQSPCSNCRRANIACVVPSNDRPPKWARRLERIANNAASPEHASPGADPGVGQVMDRLRNLEGLVRELSSQLEQAHAAAGSAAGGSSRINSPGSSTHERDADNERSTPSSTRTTGMQKHFGRLVVQDKTPSRYVGSGFWSRVSDELDGLKMDAQGLASGDSESSEEEEPSAKSPATQELERTPSERHGFLFGHNLRTSAPDLNDYRPLPSEVPFLVDIFSENLNFFLQIVHMPTIIKIVRGIRGSSTSQLTPANEALMFSIYYAAITSMEEDDVTSNFGSSKTDLNLKYRLGLEYALAKADFLNVPDLVLIQAFAIFLSLVRRHDSPRFVWTMTGLAIRMGQAIGLHRDGSHFPHLTPFEVEMRRRTWWALCMLDVRASEDQGSDFMIAVGSFDTKLPTNIDDVDISPETREMPPEKKDTLTDTSFALASYEVVNISRQMMAPGVKDGGPNMEEQERLLSKLSQLLDRDHLQYSNDPDNLASWVGITATRLVISKLTLFIYLPALFSSPGDQFSEDIRNKLLVAAIEVAEYNHMLNAEEKVRQWRWLYQTYTHWHAIVFLLIEMCRREWSPLVERAWVALHSKWLIPVQPNMDKNLRIWVPLRKLMGQARRHRDAELRRIRGDTSVIEQLQTKDRQIPVPASSGPFSGGNSEDLFRQRWYSLVASSTEVNNQAQQDGMSLSQSSAQGPSLELSQQRPGVLPTLGQSSSGLSSSLGPSYDAVNPLLGGQGEANPSVHLDSTMTDPLSIFSAVPFQTGTYNTPLAEIDTAGQAVGGQGTSGSTLWPGSNQNSSLDNTNDLNVTMDIDGDMDWNSWLQAATGTGWNAGSSGTYTHGSFPTPGSRNSGS